MTLGRAQTWVYTAEERERVFLVEGITTCTMNVYIHAAPIKGRSGAHPTQPRVKSRLPFYGYDKMQLSLAASLSTDCRGVRRTLGRPIRTELQ